MDLKDINVLIDGINLEQLQGTGIKTYGSNLITALKRCGASPNVLISKYAMQHDKNINADVLALFQEMTMKRWVKFNFKLVAAAWTGLSSSAQHVEFPSGMVVTKGAKGFDYINDVKIYSSRDCYQLADMLRYLGRKVKLKARPQMDVWHATYFTPITVKGAAKITTIHDIVPLRLPHSTTNDKGIFIQQIRDAIKSSQLIIAVSEHSKKDLVNFFNVNPEKIAVTYQSVTTGEKKISKENVALRLKAYGLKDQKYILFVGAIEPKKNLKRVIAAYLSLDINLPLVIVGKKAWLWEGEVRALNSDWHKKKIKKNIRELDYVSYDDMPAFYQGAKCLVFPSLYEGFGLPPLEAMSLGCPVITSNVSSLPEVCGNAALYVDPYDQQDIADKIMMMINDDAKREALIQAGYQRVKFFSMENYIERIKAAYAKVLT